MNTKSQHEEYEDQDAALFRSALSRAAEDLPPLPDLVPRAQQLGRGRRARARAVKTGAAFAAVTAVAVGAAWLPSLSGSPSHGAADPAGAPSAASSAPASGTDEDVRLTAYRMKAAGALDAALPAALGRVSPAGADDVRSFVARSGERSYPVALTVRRAPGAALRACEDAPEKGLTCRATRLTDGRTAHAYTLPAAAGGGSEISLQFREGDSEVSLTVSPDPHGSAPLPVTVEQLTEAASGAAFQKLVRDADRNPVLTEGADRAG
ncbi:hypothetical protein V2W30_16940 [Streptomyces sp. Q6]|uniref:Uncharacterized protein n=1 Tax=Streptomyces citrinus TaxID=3118173 RepID=A0ACD5ACH6_9ACTN